VPIAASEEKMNQRPKNIYMLKQLLYTAQRGGFAVGAFSPRYTPVIRAVLQAAETTHSPVIVQITEIELKWYQLTLEEFAFEFWRQFNEMQPTVPVGLHLDHASDTALIQEAISRGFTSVMVDGSALPLDQNIAITRKVVDLAHQRGISVEAELGHISPGDFVESDQGSRSASDKDLYTDPQEAAYFVDQTGVDALAVSVGTAHGIYQMRTPRINLERLKAIRIATPIPLVLHGISNIPPEMIQSAIRLPGGGVSKVNIGADLEATLYKALGMKTRTTNAVMNSMQNDETMKDMLDRSVNLVQKVVEDKITNSLMSADHARDYQKKQ
jgi:ketose-bisphosphate aldolase